MNFILDEAEFLVMSIFFADIDFMKQGIREYFSEPVRSQKYLLSEGTLDLERVRVGRPQSGGRFPISAAVYSPCGYPNNCIFIANSSDGWFTFVNIISRRMRLNCLSFSTSIEGSIYPLNSIRYYRDGEEIRMVRTIKDGDKWEFFQRGEPLPFESVSNYNKRRIADRLNRTSLADAVELAGFNLRSAACWHSDVNALYIDECRAAQD